MSNESKRLVDFRLQSSLRKNCAEEINEFCKKEWDEVKDARGAAEDANHRVVICLRKQFAAKELRLRPQCRMEVRRIIMESELDPKLDPPFYRACKEEIGRLCGEKIIASKGSYHLTCYLLQFLVFWLFVSNVFLHFPPLSSIW